MKQKIILIVILALLLAGCAQLIGPGSTPTPIGLPTLNVPPATPTPAPIDSPLPTPFQSPLAVPDFASPLATPTS